WWWNPTRAARCCVPGPICSRSPRPSAWWIPTTSARSDSPARTSGNSSSTASNASMWMYWNIGCTCSTATPQSWWPSRDGTPARCARCNARSSCTAWSAARASQAPQVILTAQLTHLLANPEGAPIDVAAGPPGAPAAGIGQRGRQQAGLTVAEARRRDPKVMSGRRLGPEYPVPPLDAVQVHLEDALLGPQGFQQQGEPDFQPLAHPAAAGPEEQVLGHLLAEGAGAAQAAAPAVVFQRIADGRQIEAPVLGEALILGG